MLERRGDYYWSSDLHSPNFLEQKFLSVSHDQKFLHHTPQYKSVQSGIGLDLSLKSNQWGQIDIS